MICGRARATDISGPLTPVRGVATMTATYNEIMSMSGGEGRLTRAIGGQVGPVNMFTLSPIATLSCRAA